MARNWIILDCSSLAHRLFHKMPSLSHHDIQVGVVFGFLRDIRHFQNKFMSKAVVFAWDVKPLARKKICPEYKRRHEEFTEEELAARSELHSQMLALREQHLPECGFLNSFGEAGFEADDVIASLCQTSIEKDDTAVIVSSDHDLYQLLSNQVSIFHPVTKECITKKSFVEEFGIPPSMWPKVKALAGCTSDNITGLPGIGEITAAKYLRGALKSTSKAYATIARNLGILDVNLPLTKLPLPETPVFLLQEDWVDSVTEEKWRKVVDSMGMDSLKKGGLN